MCRGAGTNNSMLTLKSSSGCTKETGCSLEDSIGHDVGQTKLDKCDVIPGDCPVSPIVGRRMREFRSICTGLSEEKKIAIDATGFGAIFTFRCSELNVLLCHMMCNNFDVENSTIKIPGRHLTVTAEDFRHVMSVRDGGGDVDLTGSLAEPDIVQLKSKFCGVEDEISLEVVGKMVVESETADETFVISLCLYALSTIIFPIESDAVDPRLLLALKDPKTISTKNWASFALRNLVEGVGRYKNGVSSTVNGCIAFLQLFYLDAMLMKFLVIPTYTSPVLCWNNKQARIMYDQAEANGGYYSTGIIATKRWSTTRFLDNVGSVDARTGLKTTIVEDLHKVRNDVDAFKCEFQEVRSCISHIEPDMVGLRNAIMTLQASISEMRERGISNMVVEVMKEVLDEEGPSDQKGGDELDMYEDDIVPRQTGSPSVGWRHQPNMVDMDDKRFSLKRKSTNESMEHDDMVKFCEVADISNSESFLITYLFSKVMTECDSLGSREIARYGDHSISRWDLGCLSPMQCITSHIVDISVLYLFDKQSDIWFMPTYFSERAKDYASGSVVDGLVSSVVTICRLRRYSGRLGSYKQIFFPLQDDVVDNWFLVVFNPDEGECEIWDSCPDKDARERHEAYANGVMELFQKVFCNQIRLLPALYARLASVCTVYPKEAPTNGKTEDSGIFLIRNMQYYRKRWFEGFNSADQRIRLALDIVNHPMNAVRVSVWAAAAQETPIDAKSLGRAAYNGNFIRNRHIPLDISGIKFKARRTARH
ncbi:putative Ulp1 protease family catalytic domain-containing protein [Rosa chinensis]|uniref:Putative Ulp1 protease family catalytic domain-containing protein n=1 Tax=Rosa chinensis TaxID=74649 RepID=A0A2P6RD30_ROSCH|nr:putative Ulp1 protease family catalytic domain-containing protein [Rosa chinensis]